MSYGWENRRHIPISTDAIDRQHKPHGGSSKKDKTNYSEKGKKLLEQYEKLVTMSSKEEKISEDENLFFVLRTKKTIEQEEKILQPLGINFSLQTETHSAIVRIDKKDVQPLTEKIRQYKENNDFRTYIREIEEISPVKIEKISPDLTDWIQSNEPTAIEIEMFPNLGKSCYEGLVQKTGDFLVKNNDQLIDSLFDDESASLRAFAKPQTARAIIQGIDSVWQARKVPIITLETPQNFEAPALPTPGEPLSNCKTICVLDTGVKKNHPFLANLVTDSKDFSSDNSCEDLQGHGTFVAGLAAYGNLENVVDAQASAKIINAKIHGATNNGYLEKSITRAVNHFHNIAKIFSLSVMYETYSNIDYPSDLAYRIDKLSNELEVIFVICTGNIRDNLQPLLSVQKYPSYFRQDGCRIFSGAEASTAITVGGIANKDTKKSLAKIGQPSPFTRRGQLAKRCKPDVVNYAGNLELNAFGQLSSHNSALGVISLSLNNTLAYDLGTSYSAPMVANILARLYREYPDASLNLLKALLIHFSDVPKNHYYLKADEALKKSLYGKGLPEFEACAFSQNYAPTYIIEDSIGYDEVALIPVYVPLAMKKIFGARKMKITLVYNPPVNKGVEGYTLVDLDFQLFKRLKDGELQRQTNFKFSKYFKKPWDNVKTDLIEWEHIPESKRLHHNLLNLQLCMLEHSFERKHRLQ
ncbi:MAG: S8 family peptidase, partial [Candidatus Bathyarchaeota archaeon]|nr:S8 family peptidase [Candidatus Bathyarchaeota archaeon]